MDRQCQEALQTLMKHCPELAEVAKRMLEGVYGKEVGRMVDGLIDYARAHGIECLRAFLIILRCMAARGHLYRAMAGTAAGQTAAATGATGGATTAGGTAAGGGTAGGGAAGGAAAGGAAFWASLLFLLFALGFLSWRVLNELYAELEIGEQGVMPCGGPGGLNGLMGTLPRVVVVSSMWGRKASLQAAVDQAQADCDRLAGNCSGSCPPGMTCRPVVAVQEVQQTSSFPWFFTYTTLVYTCPCYCV